MLLQLVCHIHINSSIVTQYIYWCTIALKLKNLLYTCFNYSNTTAPENWTYRRGESGVARSQTAT